jgi:hypothetical protein
MLRQDSAYWVKNDKKIDSLCQDIFINVVIRMGIPFDTPPLAAGFFIGG